MAYENELRDLSRLLRLCCETILRIGAERGSDQPELERMAGQISAVADRLMRVAVRVDVDAPEHRGQA